MSLHETASIRGELHLQVIGPGGEVVERRRVHNLITRGGKTLLARMITGALDGGVKLEIAVGVGTRAPANSDTELVKKVEAAPAEAKIVTLSDGAVQARVTARIERKPDAREVTPLTEAGILVRPLVEPKGEDEAAEWPLLFNRVTFDVINRAGNTEILLAWDITL